MVLYETYSTSTKPVGKLSVVLDIDKFGVT